MRNLVVATVLMVSCMMATPAYCDICTAGADHIDCTNSASYTHVKVGKSNKAGESTLLIVCNYSGGTWTRVGKEDVSGLDYVQFHGSSAAEWIGFTVGSSNHNTDCNFAPFDDFPNFTSEIFGNGGDDDIFGSNVYDYIEGGSGDDDIDGNGDSDEIYGEDGDDDIWGGDGADLLSGGDGEDHIWGGAGNDEIHGGDDNDELYGGTDIDCIYGSETGGDNDYCYGNTPYIDDYCVCYYEDGCENSTECSW